MKDILIIAQYTHLPTDSRKGRFNYLAELISRESDNEVEIVTSNFDHNLKIHLRTNDVNETTYKYTMIQEPGYMRNVCLKRFYSHWVLSRNIKKYLDKRKKPDVIYCAIPSLDVANAVAKYAKKKNIRFVIDLQDLWPEAFLMVINIPIISDLACFPMKKKANYIYSCADEIVAVSDTYCQRAKKVNNKAKSAHTVFLGTDLETFDANVKRNLVERTDDEIWLGYCGTLGHSYDLKCVIDAMVKIKEQGVSNLKFVVMGDGPLKNEFERYAKDCGVNVEFTGRVPYDEMCGRLAACDIAINCISKGAAQSIINKHADYAAAGIPVVSTQECKEYKELVEQYQMGFNCRNSDSVDLAEKILTLINDGSLREEYGKNARISAGEKFDRNITYKKMILSLNL